LGRIPSPFDGRDLRLEDYLEHTTDPVTQAVGFLKKTTVGYKNNRWSTPPAGSYWEKALALLQAPSPPSPSGDVKWADNDPVLDQGQQGTCVGHGTAQWGNTLPVDDKFTHEDALDLYYQATVFDGQPDDPRAPGGGQQGASVRSGMKALQKKGRLSAYAVTQDVATIRAWVTTKGPVVLGTDWYSDMFNPNDLGYVTPTGSVAGGHCYTIIGDLVSESAAYLINSWGTDWGLKGYFKMKWADVQALQNQSGEAWTALELP
jgi:hypothetical protein